jgi:Fibronectin type III domain
MNRHTPRAWTSVRLVVFAVLALAGGLLPSAMMAQSTITYIQGNYATPQSPQTAVNVPFTGGQTAGDLNVVVVGWNDTTATVSSVTDTSGNGYTLAVGPTLVSGSLSQSIYYAKNIASAGVGANTVTVAFSRAAAYPDIRILEYSGANPTNPLDVTAAASGSSTSSNSGSATTTNPTDLIFGANIVTTTTTGPGSGFTRRLLTSPDGDIAEDKMVTATGSYSATAPLSSGKWIMQMVAFKAMGAPVGSFAISASPASLSVAQGNQGTSTVTTVVSGGFNGPISLSASGVPSGTTVSFNPTSIPAPGAGTSTMTITVGSNTAAGTYPITVTGSGGGVQQGATVTLTVTAVPNFALSASPASLNVTQGNQGTSTITAAISGGFDSAISLSASGVPSGTTVGFNPSTIPAPGAGNSTMTITVGSTTVTGTYPITVTGNGGGVQQNTTVTLTVVAPSTTITYIQGNYATPQSTQTTVNVIFTGAQTAGDLNVVVVGWNDTTATVSSVTDISGNTYTLAVGPTLVSGSLSQSIYFAKNIAPAGAGANTVTVTFSRAAAYPDIRILEYSGADPTNPVDVTVAGGGSGTTSNSGSATTTSPTDLIFGANMVTTTTTGPGSGFTRRLLTSPDGDIAEDEMVTATGSYSATAPLSSGIWIMQMVAFRTPAGGVQPPTPPSNLTATAVSSSQINLSWTASTGSLGIANYIVYRCQGVGCANFAQIATPAGTTYSDPGLAASTSYSYEVQAKDNDGNLSGFSNIASATTLASNGASIGYVQGNYAAPQASEASVSVPFTGRQIAGDLIVVVAGWKDTTATVTSVTDTSGNTYALAVGPTLLSGSLSQSIYYAKNIAEAVSGGNVVTVNFSTPAAYPDLRILEYTGADQTNPVDVVAAGSGTGVTSSSGSATTTNATDLIFGANTATTSTSGPGSGFTQRLLTSPDGNIAEDDMVDAIGSYSAAAPLSSSGAWIMQMVAFRTPAGGVQPPTPPSNLTATAVSSSQINLSWTASTSSVGIANYVLYRCQGAGCANFVYDASPTGTTYSDTGLTANTSYSYEVQAKDNNGNLSGFSNIASATTQSGGTGSTIAYVQGNYATPQSAQTTVNVTFTGAQTAGDLNVVVVGWNDTTATVSSVTDISGNTYTLAVGPTLNSGSLSQSIYYAKNIASAGAEVNAVAVTFSRAAAYPDIRILEYSGADPTNPVDVTTANSGNSSTSNSGSATTTNPSDLIFGANIVTTTTTGPGSGFTRRLLTSPDGDIAEDEITTSTGSYSASAPLSSSGSWVMQMVALRGASSGGSGFSISPRQSVVTFTETQQFTTGGGSGSVTWSVDGVVGGSSSTGTITTSGLYTPPSSVGSHVVTATPSQGQPANATIYVSNYAGTFTYHNDNLRTGQDLNETVLTPSNVNPTQFGKLFSYPLDGIAFASPLYVANVNIPGQGYHNVVYVATENDSVYAFDADDRSGSPLWHVSFLSTGVTPVPCGDTGECGDIPTEIGITSTPVIDPSSGTLYVVAATKEGTNHVQRLHALDITTGAEKFGGPVVLQASVPGTGDSSSGGVVTFDPLRENQRPGLLLNNGVVYLAFGSHGDNRPWHGWVLGYNASTLQQVVAYNVTPNAYGGGIWQGGGGLAADANGDIYFTTSNGTFDVNSGGVDYGDSIEKLSPTGTVLDYFTPHDQSNMDVNNLDLGAGGPVMLIDQTNGPYPHILISAGKTGTIYVINRDNMGHYNANNDNQIIQSLVGALLATGGAEGGNYSTPVYFDGYVYFASTNDTLKAFQFSNGLLSTSPTSQSLLTFPCRGGSFAISANGNSNGIIWVLENVGDPNNDGTVPGILIAYNATNLATELYDSSEAGNRDTMDYPAKFSIPLVANGKVFVAGQTELVVYGLLP